MAGQPGRSGGKPKPTKLKVLTGNPGKRPLPENEMSPEPITPEAPAWMPKEAQCEWHRLVPELAKLGVLARLDRSTLTAHCLAWEAMQRAHFEGDDAKLMKAIGHLRSFIAELGLSPSARSRIHPPEAVPNVKGAERLLG
jgi:phage terminase small subunit